MAILHTIYIGMQYFRKYLTKDDTTELSKTIKYSLPLIIMEAQ